MFLLSRVIGADAAGGALSLRLPMRQAGKGSHATPLENADCGASSENRKICNNCFDYRTTIFCIRTNISENTVLSRKFLSHKYYSEINATRQPRFAPLGRESPPGGRRREACGRGPRGKCGGKVTGGRTRWVRRPQRAEASRTLVGYCFFETRRRAPKSLIPGSLPANAGSAGGQCAHLSGQKSRCFS